MSAVVLPPSPGPAPTCQGDTSQLLQHQSCSGVLVSSPGMKLIRGANAMSLKKGPGMSLT